MISDIEVIIEKFKKGEMVILVDDEDRENEGDLIVSSQYLTPEHINFMITYAKVLFAHQSQKKCNKVKTFINAGY